MNHKIQSVLFIATLIDNVPNTAICVMEGCDCFGAREVFSVGHANRDTVRTRVKKPIFFVGLAKQVLVF